VLAVLGVFGGVGISCWNIQLVTDASSVICEGSF